MKIAVVGSGFVGRATGKGLIKHGNEVTFIDVDQNALKDLREAGFTALHQDEYPKITSDITMFCLPTPTQGKKIQMTYLKKAVEEFATRLKGHKAYHLVVIRSTVPPKTTRKFVLPIIERLSGKKAGKDFGLCMQPEFLREVSAEADYARPWFILIGQYDEKSGELLEKIYRKFDTPIERMGLEEAEFQKYVHNAYNASKIAFFNEMRVVADKEGWNSDSIFRAVAESSEAIWNPMYGLRNFGPFDGSCLPKDTRALLQWGDVMGYSLEILRAVVAENLKHEKALGRNKTVRVNYLDKISV